MMFASFLTLFALAASMIGRFCEAVPDKSLDRSLRKKKADSDPVPFSPVSMEQVQVMLFGPDDYSDPTNEETLFFMDCLIKSFDTTEGDSGYTLGFAALDSIDTVIHPSSERRELRGVSDWLGKSIYHASRRVAVLFCVVLLSLERFRSHSNLAVCFFILKNTGLFGLFLTAAFAPLIVMTMTAGVP